MKQSPRRLWWRWVGASALGAAGFAFAARPISLAVGGATGEALGAVAAESVTGALVLGGVMLGMATAQWLVGRHQVPNSARLAIANVGGAGTGGAVMLGGGSALSGVLGAGVALGVAGGRATAGALQWRILNRRLSWARRWAASSVAGLLLVGASLGVLGAAGGEAELLFGATFGAVCGAVTGREVVRAMTAQPAAHAAS